MTEYRFARAGEEADILDFINLVFSQNARPHDFEKLLPKVYAHPGFAPLHALALEEGRIRGAVAMLPVELRLQGAASPLRAGYIGSVSVHPKYRGRGFMKALLRMQIDEASRRDYDFLALGGQRQRYGYFGFEKCGVGVEFHVNAANVRHALPPPAEAGQPGREFIFSQVEGGDGFALDFIARLHESQPVSCLRPRKLLHDTLRTYGMTPYLIQDEVSGRPMGYLTAFDGDISELALENKALLPSVIRCWMAGRKSCSVYVPGFDQEALEAMQAFSESYAIRDSQLFSVLRWDRMLDSSLRFAAHVGRPLPQEKITVEIENAGRVTLAHQAGQASAYFAPDAAPACRMTEKQAVQCFFSSFSALYPSFAPLRPWLPLPIDIPVADHF